MRTAQERMKEDPTFAALVHAFFDMFSRHCATGAGITPSEVREASGLAWQMYVERHPSSPLLADPVYGFPKHNHPFGLACEIDCPRYEG